MLRTILSLVLLGVAVSLSAAADPGMQDLLEAGDRQWNQGNTAEAEASFKRAIEQAPDVSEPYARLATLYLMLNRSAEAVPLLQEAIIRDAENPRLFMELSIAYLHQGAYSMADAMANEALRLDPKLDPATKMRAYIEAKQAAETEAGQSTPIGDGPQPAANHPIP